MAATLELKYFNSFWLKKLDSIVNVSNTVGSITENVEDSNIITLDPINLSVSVGQTLDWEGKLDTQNPTVVYTDGTTIILSEDVTIMAPKDIIFGPITDFNHIPVAYEDGPTDWYIEESRIRGGYDNTDVDLGVKAYIVENTLSQQHLASSMIYSGIFNSRTGVNNTNQFSVAEDITRAVEPSQGTIQKLYSEDTNLIIFQEKKVSRALIDKDAIYSAEGQPMTTSGAQVIGQIQSYAGNYGISNNPESFAVYGYRKYFVDRTQNVVLRLSQDGITEISAYGMLDFFRDNLSAVGNNGKIIGMWDMHNKQYVLSMQPANSSSFSTLSFDEDVSGWTSLFSFKPELGGSLLNNYYTFKGGNIWKHYADPVLDNIPYSNFYGAQYNSTATVILNTNISTVKNFNTVNYEGSAGWNLESLYTNTDTALPVSSNVEVLTLADLENQLFLNNFKRKEDKFFANIINSSNPGYGDVVYGNSMSGVKGFYATAKLSFTNPPIATTTPAKAELFAVSLEYVESSY
jgi:hypothetical protein